MEDAEEKDKTILPTSGVVGAVTWMTEKLIREAQQQESYPGLGPEGWQYVPTAVHGKGKVIHWAHTAQFSCHPGKNRTIKFLQHLFWWPPLPRMSRSMWLTALFVLKTRV